MWGWVVSSPRVSRCVDTSSAALRASAARERGARRELSAVCVCVVFAAQLRCARRVRSAPVSCTLLARGRWLVCVRARALRAASDVRARTLFVRAPS